ncbi:MAG: hypothetical protein HZB40_04265 [Rhodocyclales bacterium]|nr:hypothetical protein [Rhodocyclales bacterium]
MTPLAKGLGLLFGVPVVLAAIFFTYFTVSAEDRMRSVCGKVTPGMSKARLGDFLVEWRLDGSVKDEGPVLLHEPRSYGRHVCLVAMAGGIVKSAAYSYTD